MGERIDPKAIAISIHPTMLPEISVGDNSFTTYWVNISMLHVMGMNTENIPTPTPEINFPIYIGTIVLLPKLSANNC